MKGFRFRLQTVLAQRERVETQARQSLAEAEAALERGRKLLAELGDVRAALLDEMGRTRRDGAFDPAEARLYQDYMQTITQSIREQEQYVREMEAARDAHRQHRMEAAQNRQALSSLKDRAQASHAQERQRVEQNHLDELSTTRYNHRRAAGE